MENDTWYPVKKKTMEIVDDDIREAFEVIPYDYRNPDLILNMQYQKSLIKLNQNLESLIGLLKDANNSKNNSN